MQLREFTTDHRQPWVSSSGERARPDPAGGATPTAPRHGVGGVKGRRYHEWGRTAHQPFHPNAEGSGLAWLASAAQVTQQPSVPVSQGEGPR